MTPIKLLKLVSVTLIFFLSTHFVQAQKGSVKGIITDENGISMPGASIIINSINKATISDFDGKFTLVNIELSLIHI